MSTKLATRINTKTAENKPRRASSGHSKFSSREYTIHSPDTCQQVLKNRPIHLKRCTYDGKEVTLALEKDGFRKLLVPSTEPIVYPKIMRNSEYLKLLERTHNPTKEEKEAAFAAAEREKERLLRESIARKEKVRRLDLQKNRDKQGRMTDIEKETSQRTAELLERARQMKLEEEEQIQKCNKLILETKCRVVRDAQLAEKKFLERAEIDEEQRINELLEQERANAIQAEELKEKERLVRQKQFAVFLKEQIEANQQERLLEYEQKREEKRLINISSIAQQEEELEKIREKAAEHERAQRDLMECNEQLKHFKAMEEEENRIMNMRIQKFQKEKDEWEAKLSEEIRQERLRREREKDRIAEQANQSRELHAQLAELNEARIQEEVERKWRKREKEQALLRAKNMQNLRVERDEQINNKIKMQAIEIEREKQEFDKIVMMQKEAICREEKQREKKHRLALLHRSEILKQVNEKEKEKIISRQKMFEEGLAMRAETEVHKRRIQEVMERKCQEIIENKIPEIYIKDLKRNIEKIKIK